MLRLLVAAMLLANVLFFGWSRGWLDRLVGAPAQAEHEPQRLAAQVRPELLQLWPAGVGGTPPAPMMPAASASAAASNAPVLATPQAKAAAGAAPAASQGASATTGSLAASAGAAPAGATATGAAVAGSALADTANRAASAPAAAQISAAASIATAPPSSASSAIAPVCLEAGPFNPVDLKAALASLEGKLPAGSWAQRQGPGSGEWMIYMGPYPERDGLERKKAELGRIRGGVPQEEVNSPPELARGLSLGRFASQAAANATLAQYRQRGIRTARVVRSGNGPPQAYLRVARADDTTAAALATWRLPPAGRAFSPCPVAR